MGLSKIAIAACLFCSVSMAGNAQIVNLPRKNVNGASYYYYEVQPKETIYSISRKLGVSGAEIQRHNPSVADGLKIGQVLYFPAEGEVLARTHVVKNKETLYGIGKLYGVSPDRLLEWNPQAKDGIRPGQTLYVSAPENIVAENQPMQKSEPSAVGSATHIIAQGETLYSIAVAHNTTVDDILAANPGLSRDHYAAGTEIVLPGHSAGSLAGLVQTPQAVTVENAAPGVQPTDRYIVKKGETFYSIAHSHGITVEALEKANPKAWR